MKREKMEFAMNLLTSMVVRQDAEDNDTVPVNSFKAFRRSRTYASLYDPETGLWMNGPDYILEDYRNECRKKQ